MSIIGRVFACLAMIAAVLPCQDARGAYPDRPIRWIVGFPAGGSNDLVARVVGEALAARLGQPVIVENRPGGSNNVATAAVINSSPDGYTWYFVNAANFINASLFSNLPFDFLRDMAPVAAIMRVPNVMDVSTSIPATTVAEFIAYAKAHPGKLNMASSGVGTSIHLAGEMFKSMAGVDMVHIPYKGTPPAMRDLIAGHVQVIFDNLPSSIPLMRDKKVRGLAVTTLQRSPIMPELPTVAESLPGYESSSMFGIGVAHGTTRDIIDRLNREVNAVLAEPATRARLVEMGGIIATGSADDFQKASAEEVEKMALHREVRRSQGGMIQCAARPLASVVELRVSLFVPATNPATRLFETLANELRDRTAGRLAIKLFPNEALGSTAEQYDLTRTGAADLAYIMHGATPGRFPLTELAALPFVTRDPMNGTAALMRALPEHLAAEHPGVRVLFLAANAPMAIHATRSVSSAADLAGLRVRSAGAVVAATLAALGAIPANIMPLDVPAALADGRIDAAAMTFEGAMINRLAGVASHSLELNVNTVTFGLVMNEQCYASLPPDLQAAVDDVLGASAGFRLATKLAEAVDEGRRYMRDGGVKIAQLSSGEQDRVKSILLPLSNAIIDELERKGLAAEAVHNALMSRSEARPYQNNSKAEEQIKRTYD